MNIPQTHASLGRVDVWSSYLPSDLLAALLYAQLEVRESIQRRRQAIWRRYWEQLGQWAAESNVGLPVVPDNCAQPYHMFYLLMSSLQSRQALITHLKQRGILTVFHYLPLHLSDMGQCFGGSRVDCPVAEVVSDRLLRLPFYNDLCEAEQSCVVSAIREFRT